MNNTGIPACEAVAQVLDHAHGLPAFLTGSAVAACVHDKPDAYNDVDLFTPNTVAFSATVQRLLESGYELANEKFGKTWDRMLRIGMGRWHTNSIELVHQSTGLPVNVIYKLVDGHETTRMSQVLESFDFGLLAVGHECMTGRFHDMRSYFFGPGVEDGRPLGLLPYREDHIRKGLMSQFIMQRTAGRYARYASEYGYDLSLVKPALVEGYAAYASYKVDRTKEEDQALGQIAAALGAHIEFDEFDELLEFERQLPLADSIDQILASLE